MVVHVTCMGEVTAASAHRHMEGQTVKVRKNYETSMTQASKKNFLKKKFPIPKRLLCKYSLKGNENPN